MTTRSAPALLMTDGQRGELRRIAGSGVVAGRRVMQAKALLLAAEGVPTNEVARRLGTTATSVLAWRRRFEHEGVDGVGRVAEGRGRKPWLPRGTAAEIVRVSREEPPPAGSTHWTTRSLARRLGVSKDTVARVLREAGLEPAGRDRVVSSRAGRDGTTQNERPRAAARRRRPLACFTALVEAAAAGAGTWLPDLNWRRLRRRRRSPPPSGAPPRPGTARAATS